MSLSVVTCSFALVPTKKFRRTDFFGSSVDESHDLLYKNNMEVNVNDDVKFQMIMMGRSGHSKDWCLCCGKSKPEWTNNHLSNEFDRE